MCCSRIYVLGHGFPTTTALDSATANTNHATFDTPRPCFVHGSGSRTSLLTRSHSPFPRSGLWVRSGSRTSANLNRTERTILSGSGFRPFRFADFPKPDRGNPAQDRHLSLKVRVLYGYAGGSTYDFRVAMSDWIDFKSWEIFCPLVRPSDAYGTAMPRPRQIPSGSYG